MRRRHLIAGLSITALLLAACGGEEEGSLATPEGTETDDVEEDDVEEDEEDEGEGEGESEGGEEVPAGNVAPDDIVTMSDLRGDVYTFPNEPDMDLANAILDVPFDGDVEPGLYRFQGSDDGYTIRSLISPDTANDGVAIYLGEDGWSDLTIGDSTVDVAEVVDVYVYVAGNEATLIVNGMGEGEEEGDVEPETLTSDDADFVVTDFPFTLDINEHDAGTYWFESDTALEFEFDNLADPESVGNADIHYSWGGAPELDQLDLIWGMFVNSRQLYVDIRSFDNNTSFEVFEAES